MTHRGHSLNPVRHHNMRVGNHGNVKKRKARAEISRYSVPFTARLYRACGTDIPAIHYRPDATSVSA
jgi:hypothetical protein